MIDQCKHKIVKDFMVNGMDFSKDQDRSNSPMIIRAKYPWNAEPELKTLIENYVTPEKYLFARNHSPIFQIDGKSHRTQISDETGKFAKHITEWSLPEFKRLPKVEVTVTLQCAGNRRNEMSTYKQVKGVGWGNGPLGTCVWGGCRIRDVLLSTFPDLANSSLLENLFVEFESKGKCEDDQSYGSSISLSRALDIDKDVILAYEMNGVQLNPDHGYPLRVIVPGFIAARSTKFLTHIKIIPFPGSYNFYQYRDYKIFPPNIESYEQAEKEGWFDRLNPCEAMPINSVICSPQQNEKIKIQDQFQIKGYAISGDGRKVTKVEISMDKGKTWNEAIIDYNPKSWINYPKSQPNRYWSWCFWSINLERENLKDLVKDDNSLDIICRAIDIEGNIQPSDLAKVWNFRGVMCNAWNEISCFVDFS